MFGLGFGELVVIFLFALIFIGPKKLPELAKGLGKGIREFQNAAKGFGEQLQHTEETVKKDSAEAPKLTDAPRQDENIKAEDESVQNKEHHS
jgi:sec-independent protein translocase protein TatA